MAFLIKRGKNYYVRYHWTENDKEKTITRTLGTKYKDLAKEMLERLDRLESEGKINPRSSNFKPLKILEQFEKENLQCKTVQEAYKLFVKSKAQLSKKTIEAYEWPIEHFIDENGIKDHSPAAIHQYHFEHIIFKDGITSETRHYYFRHFRAWWNWLLEQGVVEDDFFDNIKKKLPKKKSSTKQKMITIEELDKIFRTFGKELHRKWKENNGFDKRKVQYWFRPIMCLYTFAGLRKNEAAYSSKLPYSGLKGKNLIYNDGELEYIYLPPGKGVTEKEIPLHPILKRELLRYLKIRGEVADDEYIFIYMGGRFKGRPVSGQVVYKEFKAYAKKAGVPTTRTIHGMRHRAVTSWIELGFSTADAQFLAGHSTQRVTEKYTHLTSKNGSE